MNFNPNLIIRGSYILIWYPIVADKLDIFADHDLYLGEFKKIEYNKKRDEGGKTKKIGMCPKKIKVYSN